jgi:1-deoxy-D-xylulose-5-phosphate reductoisomerase
MRSIILLGSTGSIGTQTLDVVRRAPGKFDVIGISANSSREKLLEQVQEFKPQFVAVADKEAGERLRGELPSDVHLFVGADASTRLAEEAEYEVAVHGVVGAAGLPISQAVLARGKDLALANKESLVIAGAELTELARDRGAKILPVDSEHSAIAECLRGEELGRVRKVLLTASGGPFRETPAEEMSELTPAEALKHPNWDMGPRITVGSATLMNKALEVIELHHLFGLGADRIEVVVHRQSIVHSMVEFVDGSVKAQMGPPDMRVPILHALSYPDRGEAPYLRGFDLDAFRHLDFEAPDLDRFPALGLGYRCIEEGEDAGCVLNAADEVAVHAFLNGEIKFTDISKVNAATLDARPGLFGSIKNLTESDQRARAMAQDLIRSTATC